MSGINVTIANPKNLFSIFTIEEKRGIIKERMVKENEERIPK